MVTEADATQLPAEMGSAPALDAVEGGDPDPEVHPAGLAEHSQELSPQDGWPRLAPVCGQGTPLTLSPEPAPSAAPQVHSQAALTWFQEGRAARQHQEGLGVQGDPEDRGQESGSGPGRELDWGVVRGGGRAHGKPWRKHRATQGPEPGGGTSLRAEDEKTPDPGEPSEEAESLESAVQSGRGHPAGGGQGRGAAASMAPGASLPGATLGWAAQQPGADG